MKTNMKYINSILCLLLVAVMLFSGCTRTQKSTVSNIAEAWGVSASTIEEDTSSEENLSDSADNTSFIFDTSKKTETTEIKTDDEKFTKSDSGAFTCKSVALNGQNSKLTGFKLLTQQPKAYELLEFEMDVPALPEGANVYKETDVDITIEMVSSSGKKIVADAFYFEEYEFTSLMQLKGRTNKAPCFRLRVNPQGGGTWDFTVTLAIGGKKVDTLTAYVNVAKNSEGSQVLQVEPNRKQTFTTVSGTITPMVGENTSSLPENYGIGSLWGKEVVEYINACAEFGANYSRIWDYLDNGSRIKKSVHTMNQDSSAMWDYVFKSAEDVGTYISFVILNHGEISTEVDGRWDASIWYTEKGGYVSDPEEFFTDEKTMEAFKTYLRYIISRWGYSEYVMCWELFNEIDHTNSVRHSKFDEVRAWLQEVTDYIREIDPYKHMVSNSCGNADHNLASYNIFDFLYYHRYADEIEIEEIAELQKNRWLQYKKPILLGEAGVERKYAAILGGFVTEDLVAFHQANWAGMMGGGAGTAMNYYWNHLDTVDGYWDFQVVSEISKLIPLDDKSMFMANTSSVSPSNDKIGCMGYYAKDYAYLWFYDRDFKPLNQTETTFNNETASIKLNNGTYYIRWVNTWTGVSMRKEEAAVTDGVLNFKMPQWSKDVVVTITTD